MNNYFLINIEFNKFLINQRIIQIIKEKEKGYVCVVDGNVLTNAHKNLDYRHVINNSLTNCCDGYSIALLTNLIYKTNYTTYTGPELLLKFLTENYSQLFLGNTESVFSTFKEKVKLLNISENKFQYCPLPFKNVDEFDYIGISQLINSTKPDIIWVSLGAPKQEIFISKLLPFINSGVLVGIGAAVNLIIEDNNKSLFQKLIKKLHLVWFIRIIKEPKRVGKRAFKYFVLIPKLYLSELKKTKEHATN